MQFSSFKWPCRIGVLSDTHVADIWRDEGLVAELESHFRGVDLLLHAGDILDPLLLGCFTICPLLAVRGNMDRSSPDLPERRIIRVGPFRIGLVHGWGSPQGLESRLLREFSPQPVDCLIYGHSHRALCRHRSGVLLFNPGSPTDRRGAPFHSVGVIEVKDRIEGRIIPLD